MTPAVMSGRRSRVFPGGQRANFCPNQRSTDHRSQGGGNEVREDKNSRRFNRFLMVFVI